MHLFLHAPVNASLFFTFCGLTLWQRSRAPAITILHFTLALQLARNGLGVGEPIFACYYSLLDLHKTVIGRSKHISAGYVLRPHVLKLVAGTSEHSFARHFLRSNLQ